MSVKNIYTLVHTDLVGICAYLHPGQFSTFSKFNVLIKLMLAFRTFHLRGGLVGLI